MGIGRNSFKAAKEKAKAEGKKIRQKKVGPSPDKIMSQTMSKSFKRIPQKEANEIKPAGIVKSPANGNAFTGAMAKTGGNYAEAKKLLADSPADYGTGSPFKLMRSKIFKK